MVRRLRDRALVDCWPRATSKRKPISRTRKRSKRLLKAIEKAKLKLEGKIVYDEEHSLYELVLARARRLGPSARINWALASTPEYKRLRTLWPSRSPSPTSRPSP